MNTYSKKENLNIPKYMLSNTWDARQMRSGAEHPKVYLENFKKLLCGSLHYSF